MDSQVSNIHSKRSPVNNELINCNICGKNKKILLFSQKAVMARLFRINIVVFIWLLAENLLFASVSAVFRILTAEIQHFKFKI